MVGTERIVPKSITEPGFYVLSQLVKKAEVADYTQHKDVVVYNDAKFVRK